MHHMDYFMNYLDGFVESMMFLEKFEKEKKFGNVDYQAIANNIKSNVLDKKLNELLDLNLSKFASEFVQNSPMNLAHLCHSVSQQFYENWMSQPIGDLLPVGVTIGNVKFKNREVYEVSRSSIKRTVEKDFCPEETLSLHVWLTFSNMTVLDLTIIPTLLAKGVASLSDFDGRNYVIWKESENELLDYIPLLQHNNFFYEVDRIAGYA